MWGFLTPGFLWGDGRDVDGMSESGEGKDPGKDQLTSSEANEGSGQGRLEGVCVCVHVEGGGGKAA